MGPEEEAEDRHVRGEVEDPLLAEDPPDQRDAEEATVGVDGTEPLHLTVRPFLPDEEVGNDDLNDVGERGEGEGPEQLAQPILGEVALVGGEDDDGTDDLHEQDRETLDHLFRDDPGLAANHPQDEDDEHDDDLIEDDCCHTLTAVPGFVHFL